MRARGPIPTLAASFLIPGVPMELHLRQPMPADAALAGTICHDAFKAIAERHGFTPDFPSADVATGLIDHLISRPDVHGVVAECDGQVVGSNFLWEEAEVAGVGPITVDPRAQNGAVGRALMEAVLQRAASRGLTRVRLVQAAYHTRSMSLYAKLGFVVREPLVVMQGPALHAAVEGHAVRAAVAADIDAVNRLCRQVHGLDRAVDVGHAVRQGAAVVVECDGRITGYASGISFFGHAVGESTADLKALIGAATAFGGPGFLLPTRNAELFRWCLAQGLRVVMPMTLMTMGPYSEPRGAFLPSILY
jgi:GNAT superfamily N-acetyltransferase